MLTLDQIPPETNAPDLGDPDVCWLALQVKPNMEKEAARRLENRPKVVYFLPYRETKTSSRNSVFRPLFSQYIFAGQRLPKKLSRSKRTLGVQNFPDVFVAGKMTRLVGSFLPPPNQDRLRSVLVCLSGVAPVDREVRPDFPQNGEWVRFRDTHELRGSEGVVDLQSGKVFVRIGIFGQVVPVQTSRDNLEPVN